MALVWTRASTVIAASTDAAWAVLGDYANDPVWRAGVSRMEQTPPGMLHDGAQAVEELRVLGRRIVTRVEVHDARPGRGFAWRAIDGTDVHGIRSLLPLDDGHCELRTERRIRLTGKDQLLQPLVSWVLARAERADLARAAALIIARSRSEGV